MFTATSSRTELASLYLVLEDEGLGEEDTGGVHEGSLLRLLGHQGLQVRVGRRYIGVENPGWREVTIGPS